MKTRILNPEIRRLWGNNVFIFLNFERMSFRGSKRDIQCRFRKHNFGERLGQSGGKESWRNKL